MVEAALAARLLYCEWQNAVLSESPAVPIYLDSASSFAAPPLSEENSVALSCFVLGNNNTDCYSSLEHRSASCASSTTCDSPSPSDYQVSSSLTPEPATFCEDVVASTSSHSSCCDPLEACLDAYEHSPLSLPSPPPIPPSATLLLKSLSSQKARYESSLAEKCAALSKQTKRVHSLSSSLSNLTAELRTLSSENSSLSQTLSAVRSDYDCSQSQLTSLRSELSSSRDSLWSLSSTHASAIALLRSAFDEDLRRCRSSGASVALERDAALQRVADAESKLVEVEAFLKSGKGRVVKHLEGELARTKLKLALVMAERDERELGNGTPKTGTDFDTSSSWLGSEKDENEENAYNAEFSSTSKEWNTSRAISKKGPLGTVDSNARTSADYRG